MRYMCFQIYENKPFFRPNRFFFMRIKIHNFVFKMIAEFQNEFPKKIPRFTNGESICLWMKL